MGLEICLGRSVTAFKRIEQMRKCGEAAWSCCRGVRRQHREEGAIENVFVFGSGGCGDERFEPRGCSGRFRVEAHDSSQNLRAMASGGAEDCGPHLRLLQPCASDGSESTPSSRIVPFAQCERKLADDEERRVVREGKQL